MAFPSGHSHRGAASHGGRHLGGPENLGPSAVRGGGVDLWIRAAALGRRATMDPCGFPVDPSRYLPLAFLAYFSGLNFREDPNIPRK